MRCSRLMNNNKRFTYLLTYLLTYNIGRISSICRQQWQDRQRAQETGAYRCLYVVCRLCYI